MGHILCPGSIYSRAEGRIVLRIRTPLTGSNLDLPDKAGKDPPPPGILLGFFMLDLLPATVTSHRTLVDLQ
jgi:hypothetical protein